MLEIPWAYEAYQTVIDQRDGLKKTLLILRREASPGETLKETSFEECALTILVPPSTFSTELWYMHEVD